MGTVRYEVLGPLAVRRLDGGRIEVGPEQRKRILAALLLKANQAVSPSELVAAAWDFRPPVGAELAVRDHIGVLRDLVDPQRTPGTGDLLISLAGGDYMLCVEPGDSDLDQFTREVEQAGGLRSVGRYQEAGDRLRTALSRWRGTPLAGLDEPVFDAARQRLAEAHMRAQEDLMAVDLELGNRPTQPGLPQVQPPVYAQPLHTPRPSVVKLIVLKLLGAAVPVVTVGMFGWLLTGILALKRRSVALGLSAAGYLGMTVWFIVYCVIPDNAEITDGQTVVTLLYLMAGGACTVQAAVVIGSPNRRRQQPPTYSRPVAYPPPVAYSQPVGYGGGLIDLNAAPAELLATVPGVTRQDADSIVFSRTHHGRFQRIDDLWTRGLLPVQLAPQLASRLVITDVQDSVGGAGQTS